MVQELNYDDNRSLTNKLKKQEGFTYCDWMWTYQSTSRTVFRGCWFMDFLFKVFDGIYNDRESKMSKIAQEAYNFGLAPHHSWMLKKVAGAAMGAIKAREKFLPGVMKQQSEFHGREYNEEEMYADFLAISQQAQTLSGHLWAWCKENGFDKLP